MEVEVKTSLLGWWAAAWLAVSDLRRYGVANAVRRELRLPRRPRRAKPTQPGLNTLADADAFVEAMHEPGQLTADEPAVEPTPIFDVLAQEWTALYAHRQRVLRAPTTEIRAAFDLLTVDWRCSHCEQRSHAECPGCSCPCGALVGAAAS
jgi:hypothetical protein